MKELYTNLVGQEITAIPAKDQDRFGTEEYHLRTELTPFAGIPFTIHTVAIDPDTGLPEFFARETKPVYIDRPQVLNGYIRTIGKLYRLLGDAT